MSLHFQLPIYPPARELQNVICGSMRHIPMEARATFGKLLLEEAYWLCPQIRRANVARDADKVPQIDAILEQVEILQTMVRDGREHRYLTNPIWEACVPLFESVGKQATKWRQRFAPEPA